MSHTQSSYIGRFAPSPSGPLHFGSLVTALASYLDAKHHHGQWLLRIEDIDTPRTVNGAQESIVNCLVAHGLLWDGDIVIQSQRQTLYAQHLAQLSAYTYACLCNRQRLNQLQGIYDGHCRSRQITEDNTAKNIKSKHSQTPKSSLRIRIDQLNQEKLTLSESFTDLFQGEQQQPLVSESGDFILRRKDGLIAYQLAVVADDIAQGVTHVIRGSDLLSSTARQRYLWLLLNQHSNQPCTSTCKQVFPTSLPTYGHIPIAVAQDGRKLSKQNQAAALNNEHAYQNVCRALAFLGFTTLDSHDKPESINALLAWATARWCRSQVSSTLSINVDT